MQVFAPFPCPVVCAAVLDRKRLGNQANEATIISRAVLNRPYGFWQKDKKTGEPKRDPKTGEILPYGYAHHSETRRWVPYLGFLANVYLSTIIAELQHRREKWERYAWNVAELRAIVGPDAAPPPFWGSQQYHREHRERLLDKDPAHYKSAFSAVLRASPWQAMIGECHE